MVNYIKLIIPIVLVLLNMSCNKTQNIETKDNYIEVQKEKSENKADSSLRTNKLVIEDTILKNYNTIFTAYDFNSQDAYSQILAVNWISKDSIEYVIDYENQLCGGLCKGIAVSKYSEKDRNTEEYSSFVEYSETKEDLLIVILIEAEKERKAKATIYEGNYASECSPYEFVMTKKD